MKDIDPSGCARNIGETTDISGNHPKFLVEARKAREKLPELLEAVGADFLRDDDGRWYVPDPGKTSRP